ncbi:hypothetical protein ACHHYP_04139 [Achlya hypogyna]|uniref:Cytochrome P450 n=1 Tax=Achlya hypogyna TaxID=1202772 RepID=A0A1V9Z1X6_ACHHY|nr:hypothetical protein ACHHYP_04139 [Achlya hypogyna]
MLLVIAWAQSELAARLPLALAVCALGFLWSRRDPYAHIPGPPSTSWLFGSGREAMDFSRWAKGEFAEPGLSWLIKYGSVYHYRVLHIHRVVVADPDALKHVLVVHSKNYPRASITRIMVRKLFGGDGLLSSEGRDHATQRKLFNPHFSASSIKSMLAIFHRHTDVFMQQLVVGQPLDLQNLFTKLTLDVIGVSAFGFDFESLRESNAREIQAYANLNLTPTAVGVLGYVFLPGFELLPLTANRRRAAARRVLNSVVDRVLEQKLTTLDKQGAVTDILDLILKDASEMPMADIRAHLLTFMTAGHETTGNTLGWTVGNIASHPSMAAKVRDECRRVGGACSWEQLGELPYLSAVINETLRLHPTAPLLASKLALEADDLPLSDGSTVHVPKGASIFIDLAAIHRNPRYWSQPDAFIPERFLEGSAVYEADKRLRGGKPSTYTFFPFSMGDKSCIGNRFAMTELLVVLSRLLGTYSVALTPQADMNARKQTGTIVPMCLEIVLTAL